jgi:drug/metabolite transporter (DMT)-like permease
MAAIALALASSVLWGLADFLGGVKSRSFSVPVVLACMYLTSLTALAVFVGARGEGPPDADAVAAGLVSGICGIGALIAFYRALAIGTMSIVAPIASTGVALPVIVGLATGDDPGVARSLGLAAAIAGILLASREATDLPGERRLQRQSVLLAIVAGLGIGTYLVLSEVSARGDVGWALLLSRVAATPFVVVFAVLALRRGARRPAPRALLAIAGIGLLDLAANAFYNVSTTIGELSTVAVASSLYPVTTVLLAAALLGERVRGTQRIGVVLALCGVVLISAGA